MSHFVNDDVIDRIVDMMPSLSKTQIRLLKTMTEENDLEGLWEWQKQHYGNIINENECDHPSFYTNDDMEVLCTQCNHYAGVSGKE